MPSGNLKATLNYVLEQNKKMFDVYINAFLNFNGEKHHTVVLISLLSWQVVGSIVFNQIILVHL